MNYPPVKKLSWKMKLFVGDINKVGTKLDVAWNTIRSIFHFTQKTINIISLIFNVIDTKKESSVIFQVLYIKYN